MDPNEVNKFSIDIHIISTAKVLGSSPVLVEFFYPIPFINKNADFKFDNNNVDFLENCYRFPL